MPTMRFSMSWFDSFEPQTDRMTPAGALTALEERVDLARQALDAAHERELRVTYEITKDGYRYLTGPAIPVERPEMPLDELRTRSFVAWRVLSEIHEMLIEGESFWRLHLKQRRRGKRTVPSAIAEE